MRNMKGWAVAAAMLLAFAVGACGGDDDDDSGDGGSGTTTSASATQEPATKPDELIIRSWEDSSPQAPGGCVELFTDQTGIPVSVDTTDEGPSHTKVVNAIRADQRPPVDVSYQLQTRGYLNAVQGLNVPISPEVAPNLDVVNEAFAKPPELPDDEGWEYANVGGITIAIVYRTDKWKESDFESYADLWDPKFRGEIFIDAEYGGSAFMFARTFGVDPADGPPESMDPIWEKYEELRPNLVGVGTPTDATKALTSGQASVAMTIGQVKQLAEEAGAPVDYTVPKEKTQFLGDAMYIHRNIPEESAFYAQKFINDCLSKPAQDIIAQGGSIPVNPDAEIPDYMLEDPQVWPITDEQVEKYAFPAPIPLMAENQDAWQASFEEAVK